MVLLVSPVRIRGSVVVVSLTVLSVAVDVTALPVVVVSPATSAVVVGAEPTSETGGRDA